VRQPAARDRADLRLVPPAAGAWLAALLATSSRPPLGLALGGLCSVAALAGAWWVARSSARVAALVRPAALVVLATLGCAAATALGGALRVHAIGTGPVTQLAAERAVGTATVVVTGDPRRRAAPAGGPPARADGVVLRARLEQLTGRGTTWRVRVPVVLLAPSDGWSGLQPSQRVRATVRLGPVGPGDDVAALLVARGPPVDVQPASTVQRAAARLRAGLRAAVADLPADQRGLVPGLVVGDTAEMPAELVADFRVAGLSHLTAVSGANVAIVLGAVLFAARWAGVRGWGLPVVGAAALAGFLVLARPEPSVLRASAMGLVVVVGMLRGVRGAGVPALGAAVLGLLLADPFLARSLGFALSVLATAGLLVLAPGWRRALARVLPPRLADAVAVPAAAQAAVAPVLVLVAPQVSLVAVPANLLAAAAVPPATVLGVLAAVTAPVSERLAALLGSAAGLPAGWIVTVGRQAASVPSATVDWPAGAVGALLLAAVLLAGGASLPALRRRPRLAVALAAVVALLVSPLGPRHRWPPPGWTAVMCDVGQGDALVLAAGPHTAVVVDAGPDPVAVDRCLRDLSVRVVPLVVLTHFHADHVEGLPGVLAGRSVGEVEVSRLPEPEEQADRVAAWTQTAGVPVTVAPVGEQRELGGVRWQILWPARVIRAEGSAPNNASVVLRVETAGLVLLLAGDLEPAAQQAVVAAAGGLLRADVLKVAHHGSRLQDPGFLAAVAPRAALVSVGAGNTYGHPAPATLSRLADLGSVVLRTDQHGDVAVVGGSTAWRLVPRR